MVVTSAGVQMGESLNTTVNGSVGTCEETADCLAQLYSSASTASSGLRGALGVADATWKGPAHDTFSEATNKDAGEIDTLGDRAFKAERALRDFAGELKAVLTKMDEATAKAQAGGLHVDGPFIVTPDPPPPAPILPTGPCGTAQAAQVMQQNQQAIAAHSQVVNDYNAKVAVYNDCKAIVTQARTMEGNAHDALTKAMGQASETINNLPSIGAGFTIASQARGFVGTMENTRRLAADEAARLKTQATFYENFALGKQADYPEYARALLDRSGKMAQDAGKLETRAQQFARWVSVIPEEDRRRLTAYPGRAAVENISEHSKGGNVPAIAGKFVRAMPYVGSLLTAGNETYGAVKGEQSWGRAAADTAATVAGGAAGSALVGVVAGSAFGPPGMLVLGVLGGFGGAKFATDIVAGFSGAQK
jgi:hypothetical protein